MLMVRSPRHRDLGPAEYRGSHRPPGGAPRTIAVERCRIARRSAVKIPEAPAPEGRGASPVTMNRTLACLLLVAACALAPATFARDTLHASAYGLVLDDLLGAFYADIVPCDDGANGVPEICFLTETVGAAFLAERLSDVVSDYR